MAVLMKWGLAISFVLGMAAGAGLLYVSMRSMSAERLGQERLFTYQRFMSYYAGRDRCLALDAKAHEDNQILLSGLSLLGPEPVAKAAERHYLACGAVRQDAQTANVPADWASRLDHSWTRYDQSRAELLRTMADALPDRFQDDLRAGMGSRSLGTPGSNRNR